MDYVWPINENTQFELGYRGNFSFQETDYNVFDLLELGRTPNTQLTNFLGFTQNVNAVVTIKIQGKFALIIPSHSCSTEASIWVVTL